MLYRNEWQSSHKNGSPSLLQKFLTSLQALVSMTSLHLSLVEVTILWTVKLKTGYLDLTFNSPYKILAILPIMYTFFCFIHSYFTLFLHNHSYHLLWSFRSLDLKVSYFYLSFFPTTSTVWMVCTLVTVLTHAPSLMKVICKNIPGLDDDDNHYDGSIDSSWSCQIDPCHCLPRSYFPHSWSYIWYPTLFIQLLPHLLACAVSHA